MFVMISQKVVGGDPLLTLIAVHWFKLETSRSKVALKLLKPCSLIK
nr:protein enhanced disease resistance 2-like isoform X2 [Tanacetum cinerariifolium]